MPEAFPVLQTLNLAVGYSPPRRPVHVVLDQINATLYRGELACLIGPNGAGKSTLLRTLAGMQPPLNGQIVLAGRDLSTLTSGELARLLSIVLTEQVDVGTLTAYALVALGRHPYTDWAGTLTEYDEKIVRQAIQAVGAVELAARSVGELSDGERQKIMIARALAQEPALMLLDEPTAFLDLPRRVEVMQMLRNLARNTGRGILLSTHDLDLALRSADRVWLLPQGGPLQMGAPEDLVLSGAFEAAFHSEGVVFDAQTGSFRIHGAAGVPVALAGEGVAEMWTRRALEREGFAVVTREETGSLRVEIMQHNGDTQWRLHSATTPRSFTTIYDLIAALRKS
jgi:iron complex transport system ATP-binding protein